MSAQTTITPNPNGPYLVTNCRLLKNMMDGKEYATDGTVALCRCGGSRNKPYCDGTHKTNGFSGDKADDRAPDTRESHAGEGVTIHDNRGICAHAGRCTEGLKAVFKLGEEPWIDATAEPARAIATAIEQCPSGALSYTIGDTEHRDRESDPMLVIVPNGPYAVKGGADLQGADFGEGASREHFTLCRCGQSKNKPFCSGAHWHTHFDEHAQKPEGLS